jgi:perosamine synthetase
LALYLGLLALNVGIGDEVIVPDSTFIASANAVILTGAKPVFIDVNKSDYQFNISNCKITNRTKAIMPVHLYGSASDIVNIVKFAKQNNLYVIEDAAQSIGVKFQNKHLGTFGDIGIFSFFADKTITTGEGAYIVCKNRKIYKKLKLLRNQGRMNSGSFIHPAFGVNFRITDMQGAIGYEQLKKLNRIIEKKTKILKWYQELLQHINEITFFKNNQNANFVPFRIVVFCDKAHKLIKFLEKNGVQSRSFFYPLHMQPCFKEYGYNHKNFLNSICGYKHGLCLPVYPELKLSQIKIICNVIKKFYTK